MIQVFANDMDDALAEVRWAVEHFANHFVLSLRAFQIGMIAMRRKRRCVQRQ